MAGIAVLGLQLAGCSREPEAWASAEAAHSIAAYEAYLADHPRGGHAVEAQAALDHLQMTAAWDRAVAAGDGAIYADFAARYPDSEHVPVARARSEAARFGDTVKVSMRLETPPGVFMRSSPFGTVESYPKGTQLNLGLAAEREGEAITADVSAVYRDMSDGLARFDGVNGTCIAVRSDGLSLGVEACPGEEPPLPSPGDDAALLLYAFLWRAGN